MLNGGSLLWLDEACSHLQLVIDTATPSDDKINLEHVIAAHELLAKALGRQKKNSTIKRCCLEKAHMGEHLPVVTTFTSVLPSECPYVEVEK